MNTNTNKYLRRIFFILILNTVFSIFDPLSAAIITVNSTVDVITDDGNCTLREAIIAANTDTIVDACVKGDGADQILLPAGTYTLTIPGTNESASADGDLNITNSLTITGAGADTTIIDGNGPVTHERVIKIGTTGITVAINGVTIQNGSSSSGNGGGIFNSANTTLTNTVVTGNHSATLGGGIYHNAGTLTLTNSQVTANTAGTDGGGINNQSGLIITGSTISGNSANNGGGILHQGGSLTLTDSTVNDNTVTLDGGGVDAEETQFTINGSTLSDNKAGRNGGGIFSDNTSLRIDSNTVSGNTALNGGGIYITRGLSNIITTTAFQGNSASDTGGGVYIGGADISTVTLQNSTISENTAVNNGGGIVNSKNLSLISSTVDDNTAGSDGGGINNTGTLVATNSTISGNSANNDGGGVWHDIGDLAFNNATIYNNKSDSDSDNSGDGGGLYNNNGSLQISNSIIAGNIDASTGDESPDCFGTITSMGNNLVGNNTGCTFSTNTGDLVGTSAAAINPLLGPLANNGGPTKTHALLTGSPAIDTGSVSSCEATDQRGITRPQDGNNDAGNNPDKSICDIGAFELDLSPNILIFDPTDPPNDFSIDFGKTKLFVTATLNITVSNNGQLDLNIPLIDSPSNSLDAPYSVGSDCTTTSIKPNGSCTIQVTFIPTVEGVFTDSFDILSNDPDQHSIIINVNGTGVLALNNSPPTTPILVAPENAATGLVSPINFKWNRSTDPDNDPIIYQITVCTDPTFVSCTPQEIDFNSAAVTSTQNSLYAGLGVSGLLVGMIGMTGSMRRKTRIGILMLAVLVIDYLLSSCATGVNDVDVASGINNLPLSVTLGGFAPATIYYWKINALDSNGGNTSSAVWNFTTQ